MEAEVHEVVCGRCTAIFHLAEEKVIIGRDQKAQITTLSKWASRRHCYFERHPKHWCIVDNSSSNGVFVDGNQIKPKHSFPLKNGMEISLGPTDLTVGRFQFWFSSTYTQPVKKQNTGKGKKVGCRGIGCERKPEDERSNSRDSSPEVYLPLRQRVAYSLAARKNCSPYLIDITESGAIKSSDDDSSQSDIDVEEPSTSFITPKRKRSENPKKRKLSKKSESLGFLSYKKQMSSDDDSSQSDIDVEEPSTSHITPKRKRSRNPRKRKMSTKSYSFGSSSQEKQVEVSESRLDELKAIEAQYNNMLKDRAVVTNERYQELLEKEKKYDSEVEMREEILAKHYADELDKNFICPICAAVYIKALTLNCGHTFCTKCMERWRYRSCICPMCRVVVKAEHKNMVLDDYIESMVNKAGSEYIEQRKKAIIDHELIGSVFAETEKNDEMQIFDDDALVAALEGGVYFQGVQTIE